jgi:hypothetical protein
MHSEQPDANRSTALPKRDRTAAAAAILARFAERTRVGSTAGAPRYLWTDAFAVCTLLGLARATGDAQHRHVALQLVDDVHQVLGRHRPDDARTGWLTSLPDAEARAHPTRGGLRIGKPLPERSPGEPRDAEREWQRDGQYFHYLTKWMHALDQAARATREPRLHRWARELAAVAHQAFVRGTSGAPTMVWKLDVALSRPLVTSMGQHDPVDGLVTCIALDATARELDAPREPDLAAAAADYARMVARTALETSDALGVGGLLFDAARLAQIGAEPALPGRLLLAASRGLVEWRSGAELDAPAAYRLAFRELGLAIGLAAAARIERSPLCHRLDTTARRALDELGKQRSLRHDIEGFWLEGQNRAVRTWTEHVDINEVMLATSLAPGGFLDVSGGGAG